MSNEYVLHLTKELTKQRVYGPSTAIRDLIIPEFHPKTRGHPTARLFFFGFSGIQAAVEPGPRFCKNCTLIFESHAFVSFPPKIKRRRERAAAAAPASPAILDRPGTPSRDAG